MYAGEVNVAQDQLPQFLKTAERLKVSFSLVVEVVNFKKISRSLTQLFPFKRSGVKS